MKGTACRSWPSAGLFVMDLILAYAMVTRDAVMSESIRGLGRDDRGAQDGDRQAQATSHSADAGKARSVAHREGLSVPACWDLPAPLPCDKFYTLVTIATNSSEVPEGVPS